MYFERDFVAYVTADGRAVLYDLAKKEARTIAAEKTIPVKPAFASGRGAVSLEGRRVRLFELSGASRDIGTFSKVVMNQVTIS